MVVDVVVVEAELVVVPVVATTLELGGGSSATDVLVVDSGAVESTGSVVADDSESASALHEANPILETTNASKMR